jgi:Na+/H+ antiporter NhaC
MPEWISVLIPIFVILAAAITKRIIPSLTAGILAGGILIGSGDPARGMTLAAEHLVRASADEESLYIIFFLFVFGAFAEIMKVSGGIKGFSKISEKYVKSEKAALAAVWLVTPFTFIDCCFHAISAGTIGKTLTDKVKGNKYKLAHVVNVTSCLLIILIPFGTTYIGYIVGVLGDSLKRSGLDGSAFRMFLSSIPYNFYAILMVIVSLVATFSNFGFKKVKENKNKKQLEQSEHSEHEAREQCRFEEKMPPRPLNLILPLIFLILSTFFFFWYTGRGGQRGFFEAFMNAEFEKSILVSGLVTISVTSVFYLLQKIPLRELEAHFLSGCSEMLPPVVVLVLSRGLSSVVEALGFSRFVSDVIGNNIPPYLIPAVIFLVCCAASYFMGSAWGTWALVMPIALPLAVSTGAGVPLIIGAVLAGGSLGDNASPLGETAVLSASVSDIPVMDHVKSQLSVSLAAVAVSAALFVCVPLIFG